MNIVLPFHRPECPIFLLHAGHSADSMNKNKKARFVIRVRKDSLSASTDCILGKVVAVGNKTPRLFLRDASNKFCNPTMDIRAGRFPGFLPVSIDFIRDNFEIRDEEALADAEEFFRN